MLSNCTCSSPFLVDQPRRQWPVGPRWVTLISKYHVLLCTPRVARACITHQKHQQQQEERQHVIQKLQTSNCVVYAYVPSARLLTDHARYSEQSRKKLEVAYRTQDSAQSSQGTDEVGISRVGGGIPSDSPCVRSQRACPRSGPSAAPSLTC